MYNNIGKKIKGLAIFSFAVGAIASFIGGIVIIAIASDSYYVEEIGVFIGVMVMFLGPLVFWILSFFLYGFGELIENSRIVAENSMEIAAGMRKPTTETENTVSQNQPAPTSLSSEAQQRIMRLNELKENNLITDEEYKNARNEILFK